MWRLATYNLPTNRGRRRPGARFDDPARGWYEMCPMKPESEIVGDVQASGSSGHRDSLRWNNESRAIRRAIYILMPEPSRAKLLALFDDRATVSAINNWRYGHTKPPQWVIALMLKRLDEFTAEAREAMRSIAPIKRTSRGERGSRQLAAWRERKARERDEKEKAAQKDGP